MACPALVRIEGVVNIDGRLAVPRGISRNFIVASSSYFEVGRLARPDQYLKAMNVYRVSSQLHTVAMALYRQLTPLCNAGSSSELTRMRKHLFGSIRNQCSGRAGNLDVVAETALPDNISFPSVAGTDYPAVYLSPERAAMFRDLARITLPSDLWSYPLPTACHKVSPGSEAELRQLLVDRQMPVLVPKARVPRCPRTNRQIIANLVGVPHKPGFLRLIFDRRMANATEDRLNWARLPHGSHLGQLRVRPLEAIR